MAAVMFRLLLLTAGLATAEIGVGNVSVDGSAASWVLILLVGLPLIVAGSAGFMVPLLGGPRQNGDSPDA